MEYILLIHNNVDTPTKEEEWEQFFTAAQQSGIFAGGSEIANSVPIGSKPVPPITASIAGFMRFDSDDVNKVHALLKLHPIYLHGGTLELCEMPKA